VPLRLRHPVAAALGAAVLACLVVLPTASAAPSTPVRFPKRPQGLPAPVAQPVEVESPAGWQPQVSCNPVPQRGVMRLRDLVLRTYGRGRDGGVGRSCVTGGSSEHKEGRAWDWMVNVHSRAERRAAGHFLAWLTKRGPDGEPGLQARRLGVMYVIYNRKIWSSYSAAEGWRAYSGSSPHTDHVHISLSWAGARGRTSFWTGRVRPTDYGPCPAFRGQPAPLTRRANPVPCATAPALVKRTERRAVMLGAASRPVRRAQRRLGLSPTGRFDAATWAAVKAYQRSHDLPVTGVVDKPTWASLVPRSVTRSVTAGYSAGEAARYADARLTDVRLRRGSAGAPVAFLQAALGMPEADRTGLLGRRTAAQVRELKGRRGLVRNAVVTPAVWHAVTARR
jgi:hypothetical protein